MKSALLIPLAVVCLAGCNIVPTYLPDGGRGRQVCSDSLTVVPVTVVDAKGAPIEGAEVSAKNLSNGKTVTGTSDGRGVTTVVDETLGSGVVRISAKKGAQESGVFDATFTCGECDCFVNPRSATLMINVAQ